MICYGKFDVDYDMLLVQKEVDLLLKNEIWLAHYNKVQYSGEWTALPLRSPNGDLTNPIAESFFGAEFKDTQLLNSLPSLVKLMENLKCEKFSVRLLNLKAGAYIKPHKDHDLSFENGEARLHFPIFTNENVKFYLEDSLLTMKEGDCWYINANLTHQVFNDGLTDRIHLVIDCKVNDWLKAFFSKGELICSAQKKDNAQLKQIISELKLQNTPTSLALVKQLSKELDVE
jgi:mannose-6-phosphate isomerase-like protein (cupin superfamily)